MSALVVFYFNGKKDSCPIS